MIYKYPVEWINAYEDKLWEWMKVGIWGGKKQIWIHQAYKNYYEHSISCTEAYN